VKIPIYKYYDENDASPIRYRGFIFLLEESDNETERRKVCIACNGLLIINKDYIGIAAIKFRSGSKWFTHKWWNRRMWYKSPYYDESYIAFHSRETSKAMIKRLSRVTDLMKYYGNKEKNKAKIQELNDTEDSDTEEYSQILDTYGLVFSSESILKSIFRAVKKEIGWELEPDFTDLAYGVHWWEAYIPVKYGNKRFVLTWENCD
jgi:hypothetical protein